MKFQTIVRTIAIVQKRNHTCTHTKANYRLHTDSDNDNGEIVIDNEIDGKERKADVYTRRIVNCCLSKVCLVYVHTIVQLFASSAAQKKNSAQKKSNELHRTYSIYGT